MIEQGSIIFIDYEPHAGHEFGGHDPKSGVHGMISMINFSCFDFKARNGKIVGKVSETVLNKLLKNANFILQNH
ncbi:hypothetical protein [Companilactobacillus hulinensis]|uniref:hypothetical protein n=1 Tax=Companilactobacillus hulinensis TaxID=2486007 RepID=UPI000F7ADDF6|nr:hypothetical protein [Companilactobacillus hulinensis]